MRSKYIVIGIVVGVLLSSVVVVLAGNLNSPGPPTDTASESYSLKDIHDRLNAGTDGSKSTFAEPASGPGSTMNTLNDIMDKAPLADNASGATTAQVLTGKTYWSLRTSGGTWGPQTGTAAAGSDVSGADGAKEFAIPDGFYSGKKATANDADLVAGNIKSGANIFGVGGSLTPGGTATAADVFNSKTAHLAGDWTLDTGTLDLACNTATFNGTANRVADAYDGAGNGSDRWCMKDTGDAAAGDIASGKKAWVDGQELTGTSTGGGGAGVPKTGQTTSYATGDDGDLEKGVAWPSPRFTDNLDGTVTDNLTGLIWLKNADCFGARVWATALNDANTLASGSCGLTDSSVAGDWRLPNVRELFSLIDFSQPTAAPWIALLSGHPFTGVQAGYYWSSTSAASDPSYAWSVGLDFGRVDVGYKPYSYYVWPVRGGQ